jgi:hypothetical protein
MATVTACNDVYPNRHGDVERDPEGIAIDNKGLTITSHRWSDNYRTLYDAKIQTVVQVNGAAFLHFPRRSIGSFQV